MAKRPAREPAAPLHALLAAVAAGPDARTDPRPALRVADVVLGVDTRTGDEFLVYGKAALEEVVRRGEAAHCHVLRVELDEQTEDLERLLGLVVEFKGRHDYEGGPR